MPAKCLTFLFIRLTDSVQEIKTAGREREREIMRKETVEEKQTMAVEALNREEGKVK